MMMIGHRRLNIRYLKMNSIQWFLWTQLVLFNFKTLSYMTKMDFLSRYYTMMIQNDILIWHMYKNIQTGWKKIHHKFSAITILRRFNVLKITSRINLKLVVRVYWTFLIGQGILSCAGIKVTICIYLEGFIQMSNIKSCLELINVQIRLLKKVKGNVHNLKKLMHLSQESK